jgi:hypothetical protein
MEMTKYARAIKNELIMELAKQGSSIEELEDSLGKINTGEGVFKIASLFENTKQAAALPQGGPKIDSTAAGLGGALGYGFGGPLGAMAGATIGGTGGRAIEGLGETALKSSMGAGALAGLTFDEMDKSVENLNIALEREREKINLVRRLTNNLKKEHGLS